MKILGVRPPGRFEWKILGALLVVAVLGLGVAAYMLFLTLGRITTLTDAHQKEGEASFERAADVFRDYFARRKDEFRRRAEEISEDPPAAMADLAVVPDLLQARVLDGTGRALDGWRAPADVLARSQEGPPILLEMKGSGPPPLQIELTFGIPQEMYGTYLLLRGAIDRERQLDRLHLLAFSEIFRGYLIGLGAILAVMPLIGLAIARRATRRVAVLRDAARRVGEGDLAVRVHPAGRDELDELGRSFDRMVAELGETRSRIEYLQKVGAWQEVARRLAHEIKNPLTPIQLAVQELVSKYEGDDPAYRKLLSTVAEILKEEIGSLRRLVEDFSAFAKLPKVEPVAVDLGEVVEDFLRSHPEWQHAVRFSRSDAPVPAMCDRMLLRRVLVNLVENGIQAAEGAGRAPEVRVTALRDESGAALVVDDNGPGVPPASRAHVFDPYVTTKEHGTGLGLAIVRKIAIDHGGDVSIETAPPPLGGARLVVALGSAATAPEP